MARYKFGQGRADGVKRAADIKVATAGRRGALTAFVLAADIPALLRKGALESLGGQLDFEHDISTIRNHGVKAPLSANDIGHYVLSAVEFGKGHPRADRGPKIRSIEFRMIALGEAT